MGERILIRLAAVTTRRPRAVLAVALALTAISVVLATTRLRLNANTDDLMGRDRAYYREYRRFLDDFGDLEHLWIVVETDGDVPRAQRFAGRLRERLLALPPGLLREVTAWFDTAGLESRFGPALMPPEDLAALPELVGTARASTGGADFIERTAERLAAARRARDETRARGAVACLEAAAGVAGVEVPPAPGRSSDRGRSFMVSANGRVLLVALMPEKDYSKLDGIAAAIVAVRRELAAALRDFPGLRAGLTGRPVLEADEMATTSADTSLASVVAFVAVGILFVLGMRSVMGPALAMASLLMSLSWTFAFAALVLGELNLLSIVFAPILVGNGIDFAIHLLVRHREYRAAGHSVEEAAVLAITRSGGGTATAAVTVAAAFFTAAFTGFRGLAHLGIISGAGILLCLAGALTVFPAMLVLAERAVPGRLRGGVKAPLSIPGLAGLWRRPRLVGAAAVLISATALAGAGSVGFSSNLLDLQATGLDSVHWERRLSEVSDESTWFAAMRARSLGDLRDLETRVRALPSVGKVESVLDVLPRDGDAVLAGLAELRGAMSRPEAAVMPSADSASAVSRLTEELRSFLSAFGSYMKPEESRHLGRIGSGLEAASRRLQASDPAARTAAPAEMDGRFTALREELSALPAPDRLPGPEDLPAALRERFVANGTFLLRVLPRHDIWQEAEMERFVAEIRSVDGAVTGVPITVHDSVLDMRGAFHRAALYALVANILFTVATFRSVRLGLLTLLPLVLGFVWMLGLMGILGLHWNLANFFAVPIVIGLGIDNGVHIVERIREERGSLESGLTTVSGVVFSSLNNAVGFGSLLLAAHRGLRSLGGVMALGALTCLLAAVIVLPALCAVLRRLRSFAAEIGAGGTLPGDPPRG